MEYILRIEAGKNDKRRVYTGSPQGDHDVILQPGDYPVKFTMSPRTWG